jgi:ubiquinone/menaquinone biosynthesis C-methylase UbiE
MHKFEPGNAARLERQERYQLIPPEPTLKRVGLSAGMTFVDIGAGSGFFSRAAAEIVGPEGRVFAADIAPGMLDFMAAQGLPPNMTTLLSSEYEVPVSDGIADMTFMAFVAHETPDLLRFVGEAARATRSGGRIVVIDWKKQTEESGPPATERLAEDDLLARLAGGYTVLEHGALNASHYYVVFQTRQDR